MNQLPSQIWLILVSAPTPAVMLFIALAVPSPSHSVGSGAGVGWHKDFCYAHIVPILYYQREITVPQCMLVAVAGILQHCF